MSGSSGVLCCMCNWIGGIVETFFFPGNLVCAI